MPAYMSHAILAEDAYLRALNEGLFNKTTIYSKTMKKYSLGTDLSLFCKNFNAHNQNTQAFFINMIQYIKEKHLMLNPDVMSLLYGHITHYFFDINVHPLVFYIEKGCDEVGFLRSHHLIEGYFSSYLTKRILDEDIMNIDFSYLSDGPLEPEQCAKLITSTYLKTYNDKTALKCYRKTLLAIKLLETVTKSPLVTKSLLIEFSRFEEFLKRNNLTLNDLSNDNNEIFLNPITGEKHNESLMQLYERSIEMSLDAIENVNKYLYGNASLDLLEKTFTNLSYDTGVSCDLGRNFTYVKKIKR